MSDQGELYGDFWILYTILDRLVGSQEIVEIKRKLTLVEEQCNSAGRPLNDVIFTGSAAEGVEMLGSDRDCMLVDNRVLVVCPDQNTSTTPDVADKTVFVMRDANSRPGYVHLELVKFGTMGSPAMVLSIVSVGNLHYISSDIYKRMITNRISVEFKMPIDTHGPASTVLNDQSKFGVDTDYAHSFRCSMWPKEADEWLNRPRLHDWPGKSLIHQIVQGGCYLVPVGDKTSSDTFLQWRISFVTAERKLIHSISRVQFLVYCLLKYLLKQISGRLKQIYGDADILSSYIIKTVLFHALELTPKSFWQEKNTFLCFFLCLKILISWVKTAHCPNYFISKNNMFLGKVHGKNQEKLLHYLVDLHGMTWGCLSIGSHFKPSIGECIRDVKHGELEIDIASPTRLERERDLITVAKTMAPSLDESSSGLLTLLSKLLCNSESDTDEYTAYYGMARALTYEGMKSFEKHSSRRGNKDKYKCLRRSKKYITPLTSACCSPGLLRLATYHYQTGDYIKTLKMCEQVISSCRIFVSIPVSKKDRDKYEHFYCGRGYNLLHKSQQACVSYVRLSVRFPLMCPSQLHPELKHCKVANIRIPPRPYAMFLSFLCYQELGDTSKREEALIQLRSVKDDECQGVSNHWIVHNLLGICYEMMGKMSRAIREYQDSLNVKGANQFDNPARERIERLKTVHKRRV